MDSSMVLISLAIVSLVFYQSNAHKFDVGGKDGWVLHPSEGYSHWSHRNRFVVNDILYFKYKKGENSVLQVTKDHYYNCNTTTPLLKLDDGSSEFKIRRSGPFFFISGVKSNCEKGQKLVFTVLSQHHHYHHSPASSPTSAPVPIISHAPSYPSPKLSPSPAPASHSPKLSPSSSPATLSPKLSPAPVTHSPKLSPAPTPASLSPKLSPSQPPKIASPPSKSSPPAQSPGVSSPVALPPGVADGGPSPAPAPAKNVGSKLLMGLPVTIVLMVLSIGLM